MPPKRKNSTATPPNRPSTSRGRSARASKGSPVMDDNDQESIDFSVKPAKRARKAASGGPKADRDQDDGFGVAEYGRSGAPKPATVEQHLMEQNRKSKQFIQSFKEQVANGRDHLQETLAALKQDLSASAQASSSSSSSSSSSAASPPDDLASLFTTLRAAASVQTALPSTKDHPLFEQTQQLLRLSRAVLECHRKTERKVSSTQQEQLTSPREMWMRDEEGMRKLLECGKAFGERVVEGWITPGEKEDEDEDGDGETGNGGDGDGDGDESWDEAMMCEAERLARGLFDGRKRGLKGEESWGLVARKQMLALTGLVETLPGKKGRD